MPPSFGDEPIADFKPFGWLNLIYGLASGDIGRRSYIRSMGILDVFKWDVFRRHEAWNKHLTREKEKHKNG